MIYIIGDLHLSFGVDKPMDIFGNTWENHTEKIKKNWENTVKEEDTVFLAGDFSWAMNLQEALEDFKYIDKEDSYIINVPIYRQDIKIDVDIIEEIIRAYGINNLESKPIETYTIGGESQIDRKIRNLRHKLLNLGLDEVLTYTLVNSSNNLFNLEELFIIF